MDDNIRFLKEITENNYQSIFDHPYLDMYRRLHEEYGICVQLNLFYRMPGFDLSQMSARYRKEWENNSNWLKLSFHSEFENIKPYESSGYDEVYSDCQKVHDQIKRFASSSSLAGTTTIHYCLLTEDGIRAVKDNSVYGLLGLFGTQEQPRTSYGIGEDYAARMRNGDVIKLGDISYASIDIILNSFSTEEILEKLELLAGRNSIRLMIHEQYFYRDYVNYQPDFEAKLRSAFSFLIDMGYQSEFYENMIES